MKGLPNSDPFRRPALVVNTRSRNGEHAFPEALDLLARLGVQVRASHAVWDPARLPEVVREFLEAGHDPVILGGGDGSVSSVVGYFADNSAVLGVLPLGTANDFARTLGIPFDLESACETIARGEVVDVDLGLAGDEYYVNVASVGLGVEVTQALTPKLKKRAGAVAYSLAALRAFLNHEPFSARITFPDDDHEPVEHSRLLQVTVGNGRFYGGGMVVSPDASVDDQTLDLHTIELGRHRDLIGVARYLKSGDFISNGSVDYYRTRRVVLETDPELPVDVDGELLAHTPLELSVVPNTLKVLVPRHSRVARNDAS